MTGGDRDIGGPPAPAAALEAVAGLLDEARELALATGALGPRGGPAPHPVTVVGQETATLDDYAEGAELLRREAAALGGRGTADRERLALNADLPQLAFHLDEDLAAVRAGGEVDPATLARSLTFLKRHLVALRAELADRDHEALDPADAELVVGLARLARRAWDAELAGVYAAAGYRRPFVDKFFRDHGRAGVPGGLLLALADLAADPAWDRFLCALKGGLTHTLLLELLGADPARIGHVRCGRATGTHRTDEYAFDLLDVDAGELAGVAVLVVENNAATGATLTHLLGELSALAPDRLGVFLEYTYPDVAGLGPDDLPGRTGVADLAVVAGPYGPPPPARADEARALRDRALAGVRARLTG